MSLVVADRVRETTSSTGSTTFNLAGALSGFQTFVAGIATGNKTYYAALDSAASPPAWEVGIGTVTSGSPSTLSRDLVLASSNSGSLVTFVNSPVVWCDAPAALGASISNQNKIINGDMRIDQRFGGGGVTPTTNQYTVDRWAIFANVSSKVSVQQNAGAVTPPAGFTKYLGITSLTAFTSPSAGDVCVLGQRVEGLNCQDLNWGTANAKDVTLSFLVYSSLTSAAFGASLSNDNSVRSYPFSFSIPVANTWTYVTVKIPGDTSGTWLTTNGTGINLYFGMALGSTFVGAANAWATASYFAPTGFKQVAATNGATFYITGVKLEASSLPTTFVSDDEAVSLLRCQRYYEKSYNMALSPGTAPATLGQIQQIFYALPSPATGLISIGGGRFKTSKRTNPTVTTYSPQTGVAGKAADAITGTDVSTTVTGVGEDGCLIYSSENSSATTINLAIHITVDAEL